MRAIYLWMLLGIVLISVIDFKTSDYPHSVDAYVMFLMGLCLLAIKPFREWVDRV